MKEIIASAEFSAFATLFIFLMKDLESVEICLFKIFFIVGLKLDERLNVTLDLPNHEVEVFDMVKTSFIAPACILPPDAFEEFKVVGFVGYHFFLLDGFFLMLEAYER